MKALSLTWMYIADIGLRGRMACNPCAACNPCIGGTVPTTIIITPTELIIITLLVAAVVLLLFTVGLVPRLIGLVLIALAVLLFLGRPIIIRV